MGTEENKRNATRFVEEVINRGNLGVVEELSAPGYVDHSPPPGTSGGAEGVGQFMQMFRAAFPDLHYTVEDSLADGDKVIQRLKASGTMKGDFAGMPASGKSATWQEIHITRFGPDGKALEHWGVVDQLGMMQQLGFAEAPGQPVGASR
ncbi:MAG: ester cyclase [Chloroflexota bacterium]